MKVLIAKDNVCMSPSGELALLKGKTYPVVKEDEDSFWIHSEFKPNKGEEDLHGWDKSGIEEYFTIESIVQVLRCIRTEDLRRDDDRWDLTIGDEFRITAETENSYTIYIPAHGEQLEKGNYASSFSKRPDENGLSYKTWFTLAEYKL